MKSTMKIFSSLMMAAVITLGATIPSYAQTQINSLTGNYLMQVYRGSFRCNANRTTRHRMQVRPGQYVCVQIDGDDDTDLDLFVYDPAGRMVGQDISTDDEEEVCFTANRGGTYRIEVRNLGNVWNQYSISF